jgi:hypothetical protein
MLLENLVFGLEGGGAMGVTNQEWEKEKYVLIIQHSGLQRALKYLMGKHGCKWKYITKMRLR